jgi:hypothetical protein
MYVEIGSRFVLVLDCIILRHRLNVRTLRLAEATYIEPVSASLNVRGNRIEI